MVDSPPTIEESSGPGEAPERHRRRRRGWLLLVALVIIGGLLSARHRSEPPATKSAAAPAARAIPVTTATARLGDIGVHLEAIGTVTPVYTVSITSRVQGQIVKVSYREGQLVQQGAPLIDIDPRPFQAALMQAKGQLARDRALLKEARIDLERYRKAYARNAIPKQLLDDQEQVVQQDLGAVTADEGVVANARVNLDYCHITSPIDGRVGLRLVDPGNIVQANSTTSLALVAQVTPITVIFSVSQDFLPQIQSALRQGRKLEVTAFDRTWEHKLATGALLSLDNLIDTTTGTIRMRALFPNEDEALFPNLFVNTRLLVDTQHGVVLLPTATIQRNAQGAFVYVIKNGSASMRQVKPGTTDGDVTSVEGVSAGEVVAISGFDKLQDGAKVVIRQPPGPSRAKGSGL